MVILFAFYIIPALTTFALLAHNNIHIRTTILHLCLGAPASNKPHSAEKSTPVWLAICRI